MEPVCSAILFCVLLAVGKCNVLDSSVMKDECKGSVTLYEGSEEVMVTKDEEVNVVVDKVKAEGCGCFTLHSKKEGRGKSFFLSGAGGEYSPQDIGWNKVRSVRKVACESRAMPVWGVILIVVGLVVVVGGISVIGFKKYRQYARVEN